MLTDDEIYKLSDQANELAGICDAQVKVKEPRTHLGSFRMRLEKDGMWSQVKIKNKNGSYVTWGKAFYPLDCELNEDTEVGRCACQEGIVSYFKEGKRYLKGEKDVNVYWTERNRDIPNLSSYSEEILEPIND